jgi:hypothetical protein
MDNKDLIRQYVDTGLEISEYQFNQLSNNDKKTYMRKRIIAHENGRKLSHWEFILLDEQTKIKILVNDLNKHSLFLLSLLNKYSNDRFGGTDNINHIFDLLFKHYKDIGIPDFALSSLITRIEDDSYIITKISSKEYINFLTPSLISTMVVSDNMVDKNGFINYLLNNEVLSSKLKPMNFIYFITYTTDKRIVDKIMTDLFMSENYVKIIHSLDYTKLKSYVGNKLRRYDDNMGGFIHHTYREILDRVIDL